MKFLMPVFSLFLILSCSMSQPDGESAEAEKAELEQLLDEFLQGASTNSSEMHDRFWDEDLIYTGSAGNRTTKSEIMAGLESGEADAAEESPVYSAENVRIRVYDNAAVVAFKLVAEGDFDRMEYYNTGTFLNRDGEWRAVAWQATRIPEQ